MGLGLGLGLRLGLGRSDDAARLRGLDGWPEDGVDLAVGHGKEGVVAHGAPEEEVGEVHDVRGADGAERAWLGSGLRLGLGLGLGLGLELGLGLGLE